MDALCRVCIKTTTKCVSLNTKIENSSNLSFFDFLNKCTSINACKNDKLPQELCSICTHSVKTFYSFVKLAEKSDTVLRDTLQKSITAGRCNDNREIPSEEIIIKNEKIEEETENFNKEDSFRCHTGKNFTGSSLYVLDFVKEEPCISESMSIVDLKNAENNESDKFHSNLDHLEKDVEEPDYVLPCLDGGLTSFDAEHSDSEDEVPISFLKSRLIIKKDETDSKVNLFSLAHFIRSNVKEKIVKVKAKSKGVIKIEGPPSIGCSDDLLCDICNRVFKTKIEYDIHIKIDHGSRKQVSSEGNEDSLKPHIHGYTEQTYKCIECDTVFIDREEFRTHRRKHVNENKLECNICGKKFARYGYLYNHFVVHEEKKKYKCSICGKSLKHPSSLSKHMKMHKREKLIECEICRKIFDRKGSYKNHLRVHTRPHKLPDEKKHECKICSKKFTSKRYLNIHMENHNGIIKKCDQCNKEFKNSLTLRKHLRWHMNPKPCKCVNCGRSFSRKYRLTKHLAVCKPLGNCKEETVTIGDSHFHSKENNEIVVKIS